MPERTHRMSVARVGWVVVIAVAITAAGALFISSGPRPAAAGVGAAPANLQLSASDQAALLKGASSDQAAILIGGSISRDQYGQAVQKAISCIQSQMTGKTGLKIVGPSWSADGVFEDWSFHTEAPNQAADDQNQASLKEAQSSCNGRYLDRITEAYEIEQIPTAADRAKMQAGFLACVNDAVGGEPTTDVDAAITAIHALKSQDKPDCTGLFTRLFVGRPSL